MIILTALILAAGILFTGYLLYHNLRSPVKDPIQAIPDRTALIIQVNRPLGLLEELTRTSFIWKELMKYPGVRPIQEQLLRVDSMSRGNPGIRKILNESTLTITLSVHGRASFDPLFLLPVPTDLDGSALTDFIGRHYPGKVTILHSPYGRTHIYRVYFENKPGALSVSVWEGICILSFADDLVKRAIDQLSLNTAVSVMSGFKTVASVTGRKVDANLYVNFPYLSLALWKGVTEQYNKGLVKFARYADWSGLDLYLKKDEIVIEGYTIASDSAMQTLALMGNQRPLPMTMTHLFPVSTQTYLIYAVSDYPGHIRRWESRLQRAMFSTGEIDLFGELNSRYGTYLQPYLYGWAGHQFGRCWIQPSPRNQAIYPITILQTTDRDSTRRSLLTLSQMAGNRTDSIVFEGVRIYRAEVSESVNTWLSPLFEPSELNCFTLMGDFLILAGSTDALKGFIRPLLRSERLEERPDYLSISEHLSPLATLSFYTTSTHLINKLPDLLTEDYQPAFIPIIDSLKKFRSLTLQISAGEGMFTTSLHLLFNPRTSQEGPLLWQTRLDTMVAGTPQIIRSGSGKGFAVLVTDTLNTLYKIDKGGQILWRQKLYGRVLGTFHQVMVAGDDSLCYLFNTEHHLYLIRSDGRLADRFPMKFPVRATNGLAVARPGTLPEHPMPAGDIGEEPQGFQKHPYIYAGRRDQFQVVMAFRNKQIYSFDLNGHLTDGWSSPEMEEEVVVPVRVLREEDSRPRSADSEKGGDSLTMFVTLQSGKVYVMDRFGRNTLTPSGEFTNSPRSTFYLNLTNDRGRWLTTDPAGDVVYLDERGRVSRSTFGTFSPGHFFFYEDVIDDGIPEFIYVDNQALYYYDRHGKLVYYYAFRHDVKPPTLIRTLDGKTFIGIISPGTNEVFLFDRHGYMEIESGIQGATPFDIGTLEDENRLNLVIGTGKTVKGFRLSGF